MANLLNGAMWRDFGEYGRSVKSSFDRVKNIPSRADNIADQNFPDSARDASTKNAFRHSLGTGLIAQEMGANKGGLQGTLASGAAKGLGYLWEGLGALDFIGSAKHRNDTRHDLNANAIGAEQAQKAMNEKELIEALRVMALNSKTQSPPGVFQPAKPFLTRSVR